MRNFNTVKIDSDVLHEELNRLGLTGVQASVQIGRSPNYISQCKCRGVMGTTEFNLLCLQLHIDPEKIKYKEPAKPVAASAPVNHPAPAGSIPGFGCELQVTAQVLGMTITYKGQPLYSAKSKIRGRTELDLVQAISYAAHMCYKACEQKALDKQMGNR